MRHITGKAPKVFTRVVSLLRPVVMFFLAWVDFLLSTDPYRLWKTLEQSMRVMYGPVLLRDAFDSFPIPEIGNGINSPSQSAQT